MAWTQSTDPKDNGPGSYANAYGKTIWVNEKGEKKSVPTGQDPNASAAPTPSPIAGHTTASSTGGLTPAQGSGAAFNAQAQASSTHASDPIRQRSDANDGIDYDKFDIHNVPGADAYLKDAKGIRADANAAAADATKWLMTPTAAPVIANPANIAGPGAAAQGEASTGLARDIVGSAVTQQGNRSGTDRGNQVGYIDQVRQVAAGQGPSTARDMVRDNATSAAAAVDSNTAAAVAQYGANSREALNAYGTAADQAALAFANSSADQQDAMARAATQASQSTRQAAEQAIRANAAITGAARGGNIGAALLNAQNNATLQTAQANQQSSAQHAQANMQAAQQAGANNRAAAFEQGARGRQAAQMQSAADANTFAGQQQSNIQAELLRAKGDIEAGRQLSDEMMKGLAQLGVSINDLRTMDQGDIDRLVAIAGVGTNIGAIETGVSTSNAGLRQEAEKMGIDVAKFNTDKDLQVSIANAANALAATGIDKQAAANVLQTAAGREAVALAAQGNYTSLAAQLGVDGEKLKAGIVQAAAALGMQQQQIDNQFLGSLFGMIGAGMAVAGPLLLAALLSDPRSKDVHGSGKVPDFSAALPYVYTYKQELSGSPYARPGVHTGPMSTGLPAEVKSKSGDGYDMVDKDRLLMAAAAAIGDLQRKVG